MIDTNFWNRKKVFITGHTGFKGSWLCLWLHALGAEVHGYALRPPTSPSLYELCNIDDLIHSTIADIRNGSVLMQTMQAARPEIVLHLAAQPLVRDSYKVPVDTFSTNVMGTVNLLEAVRSCSTVRSVINVTTDKCYENKEWIWSYRENDPLGGYDPYSSSKACSELVTSAYRTSYFHPSCHSSHRVGIATARAGNVIGGGDWSPDRLIPDCIRSLLKHEQITIRNPQAIRPWQHVLEPLNGYLLLAQKLFTDGSRYAEAWNFGPEDRDGKSVEWIVRELCDRWGQGASFTIDKTTQVHEAHLLKLDSTKAKTSLDWRPRWRLERALDSTMEWTRAYMNKSDLRMTCAKQIEEYSLSGAAQE